MIKSKHQFLTLTLGIFISLLVLVTPINAQDQLNQPTLNQNENQYISPGGVTQTENEGGFNWWWLLPLALLPLIFLLFRRPEEKTRRDTLREDVAYHDIDKTEAPYEEETERQKDSSIR